MKRLNAKQSGVALLLVQVALACSIAAKYTLDRATRPRVWARALQYDPSMPLRGRYLALQLTADGCSLQASGQRPAVSYYFRTAQSHGAELHNWSVNLVAKGGVLTALADPNPRPGDTMTVTLPMGADCHNARVDAALNYFIPEYKRSPFPLAKGSELWVEVTVPSTGPPRPIQLATSGADGWRPLDL